MPVEYEKLRAAPYAKEECQKCGQPFPNFMRGQVQSDVRRFFAAALLCSNLPQL